jgi:chromate reductase
MGSMRSPSMRILGISGSLQARSSNTAAVRAAAAVAPEGVEIEVYPSIGALPHFNADLDVEDAPAAVSDFRARLRECRGLLIATPEYAHGAPGVLKNALDWIVSSGELMGKPIALMSSSPNATGGMRAQLSLIPTLLVMDARIVANLTLQIARKNLDERGRITDGRTLERISEVVRTLADVIDGGLAGGVALLRNE